MQCWLLLGLWAHRKYLEPIFLFCFPSQISENPINFLTRNHFISNCFDWPVLLFQNLNSKVVIDNKPEIWYPKKLHGKFTSRNNLKAVKTSRAQCFIQSVPVAKTTLRIYLSERFKIKVGQCHTPSKWSFFFLNKVSSENFEQKTGVIPAF